MDKLSLIFGVVLLAAACTLTEGLCNALGKGACKVNSCDCLKKDPLLEIPADRDCDAIIQNKYTSTECSLKENKCFEELGCGKD